MNKSKSVVENNPLPDRVHLDGSFDSDVLTNEDKELLADSVKNIMLSEQSEIAAWDIVLEVLGLTEPKRAEIMAMDGDMHYFQPTHYRQKNVIGHWQDCMERAFMKSGATKDQAKYKVDYRTKKLWDYFKSGDIRMDFFKSSETPYATPVVWTPEGKTPQQIKSRALTENKRMINRLYKVMKNLMNDIKDGYLKNENFRANDDKGSVVAKNDKGHKALMKIVCEWHGLSQEELINRSIDQ